MEYHGVIIKFRGILFFNSDLYIYIGLYFPPQETMVVFACGKLPPEMFGDQLEVLGSNRLRNRTNLKIGM